MFFTAPFISLTLKITSIEVGTADRQFLDLIKDGTAFRESGAAENIVGKFSLVVAEDCSPAAELVWVLKTKNPAAAANVIKNAHERFDLRNFDKDIINKTP